ncbi:MAG: Zn-ribbon domain-containing OB-fold protein [Cupriavidus necator]
MSEAQRPLPRPTEITEGYWHAAAQGRLVVQGCRACGHRQFYPRTLCLACESDQVDWTEVCGLGSIYTFTINHRAPNTFMKARVPYAVAIVELDEGVRMMANILNASPEAIAIGKRVRVVFEKASDDVSLPQFEMID